MKNIEELLKNKENTIQNNNENFKDKCAVLEQEVKGLTSKVDGLTAKVKWYEEQFRIGQQARFGASSEKTSPDPNQISFLNEAEKESNLKEKEPTVEEITYKRRKKKRSTKDHFKDLPVEVIEYDLAEDEKDCPKCDESLHKMSKEIRKELKIIPAELIVVEHVRHVYACRACELNEITTPIITADMPKPVLAGSFVSPSLMAYVMTRKYAEAMPLYRQEQQFKNFGVDFSRQTLSNWVIRGANDWLKILYDRMHEYLQEEDILHADETPLQVLNEEGRTAQNKSYMWLYATGKAGPPIFLYDYRTTRAKKHPQNFLEKFKGFLHVDGYSGYHDIPDVTLVGCIAHARRKFADALKAVPKGTDVSNLPASKGLEYCNELFKLERTFKDLEPDERHKLR